VDNTTLQSFLLWLLTGAGAGAATTAFVTWFPYVGTAFDKLEYEAKRLAVLVLSVLFAFGAAFGLAWLGFAPVTPELWYKAAAGAFVAYTTSQIVQLPVRRAEIAKAAKAAEGA